MQRPKLLGLALLAMFALSAVVSTTALAAEPLFLILSGQKFPVSLTITSGLTTIEKVSGGAVVCHKDKGTGLITSAQLGAFAATFEECETMPGKIQCRMPGGPAGILLFPEVRLDLVSYLIKSVPSAGLLTLLPPVLLEFTIECGTAKFGIKGGAIGSLSPLNSFAHNLTLTFEQVKGVQFIKECEFPVELCARKKFLLELNAGTEEAGMEGIDTLETGTDVEVDP